MNILFIWPNKDSFGFKPIGISLLSSIARSLNWNSSLFDTTEIDFGFVDNTKSGEAAKIFKPVDMTKYGHLKRKVELKSKFIQKIEETKPDCLAFSVLSDEFLIAAELTSISKDVFPEIPIIWGGKYPTLNPVKTLEQCNVDYVCCGEGLDGFKEFLIALSSEGRVDIDRIPNIWINRNGTIIKNEIRPLRKNLDSLPYVDWEIFDKRQFYKPFDGNVYFSGDHMLNWGCPHHCSYCINHFYHKLYEGKYFLRRYSNTRIIDELKNLKEKYRLQFFKFHDEDFLMRPYENLKELGELYKEKVNLPFVIETNPKSVNEKKVELLKNMNCVSVSLAVETGDAKLRKNMLKRVDKETDVIRACSLLKEANIRTSAFVMLGLPFESRVTYEKTVELLRKANVQYPCPGFFYPFEGTTLREISINNSFFDPKVEDAEVFCRDKPALHFKEFTESELIEMRNIFSLFVKLPKYYFPFISRSENNDQTGIKLRKILLKVYDNTVWKNDGWFKDDYKKNEYLNEINSIWQP